MLLWGQRVGRGARDQWSTLARAQGRLPCLSSTCKHSSCAYNIGGSTLLQMHMPVSVALQDCSLPLASHARTPPALPCLATGAPLQTQRFLPKLYLLTMDGRQGVRSTVAMTRQLPSALQLHILSLLPPNERALSGRLVSLDAAEGLSSPQHCTASLSQPLPPHAVPWAVEAGQQHVRQLPFWHRMRLIGVASASGGEVNLEVVWELLQPSVFPKLLQRSRTLSAFRAVAS